MSRCRSPWWRALTAVAAARTPSTPAWLYAVFAGTWMVNLVTSVLAHGSVAASLVRSRSALVRVVKLARDYGAVIAVCGLVVALRARLDGVVVDGDVHCERLVPARQHRAGRPIGADHWIRVTPYRH